MRLFILILSVGLMSFGYKNSPNPGPGSIVGNWRGSYGTTETQHEFSISINPGNSIRLNDDYNTTAMGTYQLLGDSSIIITCSIPAINGKKVILKGAINRSKTFVDGEWEIDGSKEKGSFYLQKNILASK